MWSKSIARSLCFPIMPLYSGLVKILLLPFYLPSDALCTLFRLICCSMLRFLATGDDSMSWWAVCVSRSGSPLLTECLQATPSFSSSSTWDGRVYSAATFPATVSSQFKLELKKRKTTTEENVSRSKNRRGGCSGVASQWVSCYN